jgi:hypothetical protein
MVIAAFFAALGIVGVWGLVSAVVAWLDAPPEVIEKTEPVEDDRDYSFDNRGRVYE